MTIRVWSNRARDFPFWAKLLLMTVMAIVFVLGLRALRVFSIPARAQAIEACTEFIGVIRGFDLGEHRGPGDLEQAFGNPLERAKFAHYLSPKWADLKDNLAEVQRKAGSGSDFGGDIDQGDLFQVAKECGKTGVVYRDPLQSTG